MFFSLISFDLFYQLYQAQGYPSRKALGRTYRFLAQCPPSLLTVDRHLGLVTVRVIA